MSLDHRQQLIKQWLESVLPSTDFELVSASSDASFRRYFRVTQQGQTWIVMDAPPEHENLGQFTAIAQFLYAHKVNVPEIYAQNTEDGFLLLSDFGRQAFLDALSIKTADSLYQSAMLSLLAIQTSPADGIDIPLYDQNRLQQEMELFPVWFLDKHLAITPPDFLQAIFDQLINSALEQPQVIVHRDYHSRNLMNTPTNSPGIIDFQDAVIGPISYDLVSLLRDCYISWPDQKIDQWIQFYMNQAQQHGMLHGVSFQQFSKWFDLMGLQRHLKVLGIFSRLNYRDNKPNYMNDLPLTLNYVRKISSRYSEFDQLSNFLAQQPEIVAIS